MGTVSVAAAIDQQAVADELLRQTARIRRVGRRRHGRPRELERLTGAQLELVRLVRRRPGVSVAQAAAELGVAPNTVSTLVRELTAAGMLVRRTDATDRRVARLALSDSLDRRFGEWRDRRTVALGAALATLDPAQQATIASATELLARVADELECLP
jgi:DNA-binding MarR family transcriptional regulator